MSMDNMGVRVFGFSDRELNVVPGSENLVHFHSLLAQLGTDITRYREYITFHSEYTYLGWLIAYKRA